MCVQVLARSSPEDKLTLVSILKKEGEVVAVTGAACDCVPGHMASMVYRYLSCGKPQENAGCFSGCMVDVVAAITDSELDVAAFPTHQLAR